MNDDMRTQGTDDDRMLARLRSAAAKADPVPDKIIRSAQAAFAWRTIDTELAALAFDSQLNEPAVSVRGASALRLLSFESPALAVEVEVEKVGSSRRLIGQLVPPSSGSIEIRQPEATSVVEADSLGRFHADDLVPGPVSLRCRTARQAADPEHPATETDWVVI